MGKWNHHGMDDDEEIMWALEALCLTQQEIEALIEACKREQWVWAEMAKREKGQEKRKSNLISKWFGLRAEKWIDIFAKIEIEYEEEHGEFAAKSED